jgi:hypothetical protein
MPENISGVPARRSVFHLTSPLQELGQQLLSNQQPGLAKFLAPVTPPLAQSTAFIGPLVMSPGGQSNLLLIRRLLHPSTVDFDPIRSRFFAQLLPKS